MYYYHITKYYHWMSTECQDWGKG